MDSQHEALVDSLCNEIRFRRLIRKLYRKNTTKLSLSKILVAASIRVLNEETQVCQYNRTLRRHRHIFTQTELTRLESVYNYTRYPSRERCQELGNELQLDIFIIRSWFARRRDKYRREQQAIARAQRVQRIAAG